MPLMFWRYSHYSIVFLYINDGVKYSLSNLSNITSRFKLTALSFTGVLFLSQKEMVPLPIQSAANESR